MYYKSNVCFDPERVGCVSGAGGVVHYLELLNYVFQVSGEGPKGAGGSSFEVYPFVKAVDVFGLFGLAGCCKRFLFINVLCEPVRRGPMAYCDVYEAGLARMKHET